MRTTEPIPVASLSPTSWSLQKETRGISEICGLPPIFGWTCSAATHPHHPDMQRRIARERVPTIGHAMQERVPPRCHSFAGAEEAATGAPWACAPSLVRRLDAVTANPTARMSMAPLKMGSTKKGAPIWLRPATVTARTATANIVPQTLTRPGRTDVAPRSAAVKAGRGFVIGCLLDAAPWRGRSSLLSCQFDQARGTRSIEIFKACHAGLWSDSKLAKHLRFGSIRAVTVMTRDPSAPLPPAEEKVGSLPLGTHFFDLAERYVYVAVATLLLLGAVATIGHALFIAIMQTWSGVGLLIPIFSLLNDLLLVLIITEVLRTVVGFIRKREPGVKVGDLTPFLVIGAISVTRRILAIGATVSVQETHHMASQGVNAGQTGSTAVVQATSEMHLNPEFFRQAMVELGVNGLLIVVITASLVLIRQGQVASHEEVQR